MNYDMLPDGVDSIESKITIFSEELRCDIIEMIRAKQNEIDKYKSELQRVKLNFNLINEENKKLRGQLAYVRNKNNLTASQTQRQSSEYLHSMQHQISSQAMPEYGYVDTYGQLQKIHVSNPNLVPQETKPKVQFSGSVKNGVSCEPSSLYSIDLPLEKSPRTYERRSRSDVAKVKIRDEIGKFLPERDRSPIDRDLGSKPGSPSSDEPPVLVIEDTSVREGMCANCLKKPKAVEELCQQCDAWNHVVCVKGHFHTFTEGCPFCHFQDIRLKHGEVEMDKRPKIMKDQPTSWKFFFNFIMRSGKVIKIGDCVYLERESDEPGYDPGQKDNCDIFRITHLYKNEKGEKMMFGFHIFR